MGKERAAQEAFEEGQQTPDQDPMEGTPWPS